MTKKLLIVLLSLIGAFGAGEVYLRYVKPHTIQENSCRSADPKLHHSLIPNSKCTQKSNEYRVNYVINSIGMRDREFSIEKPDGVFRILMLGDSFTEGGGVKLEQSFVKLVEQKLLGHNKKVEVLNAGVGSYSPGLEYVYLLERGLSFDPDLVVVNLDQTDLYDDYQYKDWLAEHYPETKIADLPSSSPTPTEENVRRSTDTAKVLPLVPVWVEQELLKNSELYRFLVIAYLQASGQRPLFEVVPGDIRYDILVHTRERELPDYENWFARTRHNLILIRDLLKEKKIDFLLTAYPHGHQVSEKEWDQGRDVHLFERNKIYSTRIFDSLEKFSEENSVRFLNLLEDFRSSKEFPLFYPFDGHFTKVGHEVAAQGIYNYLKNFSLTN